jgi:hypothetical protein
MECSIEHCYLGAIFAEELTSCQNAFYIIRIVKGREIDTVLNPLQHLVVNQSGFLEQFSAVYYAVSHGMYIGSAPDLRYT